MHIAFRNFGSHNWIAGSVTLETLCGSLDLLEDRPRIALTIKGEDEAEVHERLACYVHDIVREPEARVHRPPPSLRLHAEAWLKRKLHPAPLQPSLMDMLAARGVECLFGLAMASEDLESVSLPYVTWVMDFQYKHLPSMFSPEAHVALDRIFRKEAALADIVLVNNGQELADLSKLVPEHAHKARLFNFVATVPSDVYDTPSAAVASKYQLPPKFICLPNQFWKHKNHMRVLEALRLLKAKGVRPVIVSTGNVIDGRHTEYFCDILQKLSEWGLREQFIILGLIPRPDVWMLMRQSVCVMNASLFEGIGLSVAESISMGKRLLISDLKVFREQQPPAAIYFNPCDPEDMATKLDQVWKDGVAGPDAALEAPARAALEGRRRRFATEFMSVIREAIERHRKKA